MSASRNALPFAMTDSNDFRNIFLGQRCPLLTAAVQGRESGRAGELIEVLTGADWRKFKEICDDTIRGRGNSDSTRPSVLLQSRADLVLAALGYETASRLQSAVAGSDSAMSHLFHSAVAADCQPAGRFRHTAVRERLYSVAPGLVSPFETLAGEFGGWNPALLSAAAACAELFGAEVTPSHTVRTHLLFTLGKEHGGVLGKLTLQRINFNANAGGGAVYPDPVRNGFLKYDADFQQSLQQAWWREIRPFIETCNFDICWSWQLAGDDGRTLGDASQPEADLRIMRSALLRPVCGRSAGMAFACAFRALRLQEDLDPHMVITADFADHFNEADTRSSVVGGVPDKLRADLEQAGIDEVLTCSSDQMFQLAAKEVTTESDGTVWLQPQRGRLKLIGLSNLDQFYGRASRHARMTRTVKQKLAARAKLLLETTCSPYMRSSLSERRPGDPLKKEPPEVPVPLERRQVKAVLRGRLKEPRRLRLLAESGLGKSTLLIEAEYLIASADDSRIPLRLGAGPKATVRDDNSRWLRLPLLSDFQWDKPLADLLADFAERLLGELLPDEPATTRSAWLQQVVERGEVVFLLDSLDQTTGVVRLAKFLQSDGVRKCSVLLSARPETRRTQKSQAYDQIPWRTVWVDPFDEKRIRRFWDDAPLLDKLLESDDWAPLRQVPVLLQQMKKLAQARLLENLPNREAVYHRTLEMLVQHGHGGLPDSGQHEIALDDLVTVEEFLSQLAWETIQLEATQGSVDDAQFTGELSGASYSRFAKQHRKELESLDQLNLTTRQTYLGESGILQYQFAWRHFSFCEWFAGLHLAAQPANEQSRILQQHALDERWRWIIRFALSAAQRQKQTRVVTHLARTLLEAGAPFLLWTAIKQDHVTVPADLDELCRWLVHRDNESWETYYDTSPWRDRGDRDRPHLCFESFKILKRMFRTGDKTPWLVRDSRWLHAAWQLVVENTSDPVCKEIHDGFLSEFEARVRDAATRNQNRFRKDWRPEDRGLLQLVPDDVLLELGVLPQQTSAGVPTLQALQHWPGPETGEYETRRDQFNSRLKDLQANYCLCPPVGWEHPYAGAKGEPRDPRECRVRGTELRRQKNGQWIEDKSKLHYLPADYQLQRTPVTNLQFEAFDGYHRRFRQWQWYRPNMETEAQRLDDHPVVEVTAYQGDMLVIWLTGHGAFGTFRLPFQEDWEACARAGRDGETDEFGIPWCDEQQRPILNGKGQEQFDSMSSHGANFDGKRPYGQAKKGPHLNGTVPVGRYPANGLAVVDCHGQVGECMQNLCHTRDRSIKGVDKDYTFSRCWVGAEWHADAQYIRSSYWNYNMYERNHRDGLRLSRTK